MTKVAWSWLGRVEYSEALTRQRLRRADVIQGAASEVIWLLEHDSVITTGRRSVEGLPSKAVLAATGTQLVHTERGGLATWHGPGQLVAYAIVNAWDRKLGARGTVCAMEQGVIHFLQDHAVEASRRPGYPGVWVGRDKICAVGMHFSRGVSMHGVALNLATELPGFDLILPCGIRDGGVTSLGILTGIEHSAEDLAPALGRALQAALSAATENKASSCVPNALDGSEPER